jgi:hypothetical protein
MVGPETAGHAHAGIMTMKTGTGLGLAITAAAFITCGAAEAAPDHHPMIQMMADTTVVVTGHDLTVDQVVQVARSGAKVKVLPVHR